ncbi:ATP-dependent helicase, partial [bacterium]|nr:ATP-dependent helicase [bacterium]
INGKYLVLAGPGTGKTFTVAYRIKNMIEKGIAPKKILCLTFTDTATVEMKNKIISAFKGIDKGVNVFTYHGFCNSIINEYPEEFGLPKGCKKVPDAISRRFLKECIDSCDVKYFRNNKNNPYNFVNIIFSSIGEIKKNRLAKHQFFENLKTNPEWYPALEDAQNVIELKLKEHKKILKKDEKEVENLTNKIERANELWMLYECYQEKMEKSGFFDYDDMLSLVLDKFESNPNFLEEIANQYEYILIDEYQDTNKLQYTIAKELAFALKSQNIFVVGDDDQIIYSFQGANLDTLENFLNEFENTKVICLQENMRSTQTILDLSRAIITQDARRLEINPKFSNFNISKELISKNKDMIALDHSVQLTKFHNPKQENIVIIDKIEKEIIPNLKENEKLSDIAILTTSNDDLKEYEKLLHDRNIPCELKEGRSIFEINSFVTLFSYLQMLSNPELYSDKILKLLLMPPFKVSALDFAKIITEISKNKTFIQTLKEEQNWIEKDKIDNFLNNYNYFLEFIPKDNIRYIIMDIGSKTRIFQYFINSKINKEENILAISKMLEIANEFYDLDHKTTLEEFIEYI